MNKNDDVEFFLPDFCDVRMVFATVVLGELLAFILTLTAHPVERLWDNLAMTSLFIQWHGLSAAALLCLLRRHLAPLGDVRGGLWAYGLLLPLLLGVNEAAFRTAAWLGISGGAGHWEFQLRNFTVAAIIAALTLRYLYLQHHWRRRVRAEDNARLQALQARIRPHFLFNGMNTIASLIRSQPEAAEAAVEDISDLFRASLAEGRRLVPLEDEVWLARRYLHIETLRLGARLAIRWNLEALPPTLRLPPLTLQPLLENAVYHGIEPLSEGGEIRVEGVRRGAQAVIAVTNPLPPGPTARGGNRLALDNIRERLGVHFGRRARLETVVEAGHYTVRVLLPLKEEREK